MPHYYYIDRFTARINHDLALLPLLLRFLNDITMKGTPTICFRACFVSINIFETASNVTTPPPKWIHREKLS